MRLILYVNVLVIEVHGFKSLLKPGRNIQKLGTHFTVCGLELSYSISKHFAQVKGHIICSLVPLIM